MDNKNRNMNEYYTIDIIHIGKMLLSRAWLIVLCGILAGALAFSYATFAINPTYSAAIKLYVNNNSVSIGNMDFSISASQLSAAQALVKTYGEILDSRSTLERVIDKAEVDYTWKQLSGMIKYEPSNETEIMRVTVTTTDPYEASRIANTIAEVLPIRIAEIIDGASMEVVDAAVPDLQKVAPSITKYTAVGFILGALVAVIYLAISAMLDNTIKNEDYIIHNYKYPILAKIPDLMEEGNKSYRYYRYGKSAKGEVNRNGY
jgi:capsular polysaccharide biosynthesis protein